MEVKSGYGLTTEDELKMLRAIHAAEIAGRDDPRNVPRSMPRIRTYPITSTAPSMKRCRPSWRSFRVSAAMPTARKALVRGGDDRLFGAASDGCPIRVHTDQFNSLG